MYYLLIPLALLVAYYFLRPKSPSFKLVAMEKATKGWRGRVSVTYKGQESLTTWVSDHGVYWYNTETFQTVSPSNWGGDGDPVADLLEDAMNRHKVSNLVESLQA